MTPVGPSVRPHGLTTTADLTTTAPLTPTTPIAATRVFTTVLTGRLLKTASVGYDEVGKPEINFELLKASDKPEDDGPRIFGEWTTANVGKYLAIALDKKIISAPQITTRSPRAPGRITGRFTLAEAQSMVVVLSTAALPVPLEIIENRTVGPTLGQDSIQRSVLAGFIGLLMVIVFMIIYYRLPGVLAAMALIYAMLTFALFKLIPVTLTLAGIAGFILSIGMAVDANILIFERMKEEMRTGKTLGAAIEAGFARAWNSIRDSNASTHHLCHLVLLWLVLRYKRHSRLCAHAGDRRSVQHVHGHHGHPHLPACDTGCDVPPPRAGAGAACAASSASLTRRGASFTQTEDTERHFSVSLFCAERRRGEFLDHG